MATYQDIVDTLKAMLDDEKRAGFWLMQYPQSNIIGDLFEQCGIALETEHESLVIRGALDIPELNAIAHKPVDPFELLLTPIPCNQQTGWNEVIATLVWNRIIAHFIDIGNAYLAERESEAGE